ncbi:histidinol-phosphate transaminase [Pseudogracilibacillus auburnensis]|uniref:Histidinol-phosphate aminotransferase n=1 Tax=Pseudogracilibacillus auburnensis TaxID=1494959 RepID=A0A2V3WE93_9BACI|nr:histidinol-phosphate transaminase [Pseudogracilibacillus auburnensis]PXW87139.1 histidinol-phosphate aminotransferase [Pseudogracilibacillus auburnensis]
MIRNEMRWRKSVQEIAPYVPGKSIEEVKEELKLEAVHRLASNENPLGPSLKAQEAIQNAMTSSHLYPDASAKKLRQRLATLYHVHPDEVLTGNGADNVISLVISAYVNEGDEVLYCSPTFPAYRSATLLMGGKPVELPLTVDWTFDLEALKQNITERTKLIFICNPNNPTGTIVDSESLEQFIKAVPKHVTVVLDEAYIEYVHKENYKTGIDFFKDGYPIITIRTFSKFYSLAGLRVGYAIASEERLQPILRLREPFACNRIAIEAAMATLDDTDFTKRHFDMNEAEKHSLKEELTKLGFTVYPSSTNFLFVHVKRDAKVIFDALLQKGIIIRPCKPWGYDEYVRISIGTKEQNDLLIDTLKTM